VRSRQGVTNSPADQGLGLFVALSPDSFSSISFKSRCMARPRFPPGVGGRGGGERAKEEEEGALNLTLGLDGAGARGGGRAATTCVEPKSPSCPPALECDRTNPAPPLGAIWEELEVLTRLGPLPSRRTGLATPGLPTNSLLVSSSSSSSSPSSSSSFPSSSLASRLRLHEPDSYLRLLPPRPRFTMPKLDESRLPMMPTEPDPKIPAAPGRGERLPMGLALLPPVLLLSLSEMEDELAVRNSDRPRLGGSSAVAPPTAPLDPFIVRPRDSKGGAPLLPPPPLLGVPPDTSIIEAFRTFPPNPIRPPLPPPPWLRLLPPSAEVFVLSFKSNPVDRGNGPPPRPLVTGAEIPPKVVVPRSDGAEDEYWT